MSQSSARENPFSRLRRNAVYGLLSTVVPTLILLAAYPLLIRHLGAEAVGVYLLATGLSSAWRFIEFGVSAVTIKFVSEDLAKGDPRSAADIISASLIYYILIGALGALGALPVAATGPATTDLGTQLSNGASTPVNILVLLTLITLLPGLLLSVTGFTRILIVLGFVRNALGTPTMPPNQVLVASRCS